MLRDRLDPLIDGHNDVPVVIDLAELTYCDSSGLRELISAAARCKKRAQSFRVIRARAAVKRVIEITATTEAMNLDGKDF
jgi:anti-anti-sigma factor